MMNEDNDADDADSDGSIIITGPDWCRPIRLG